MQRLVADKNALFSLLRLTRPSFTKFSTKAMQETESENDILTQMRMSMTQATKNTELPQVYSHKDDVVQIRNPPLTWQNGRVISIGDEKALLLSLHEKRAAALYIKRSQHVDANP